jgi:hypothetical protein
MQRRKAAGQPDDGFPGSLVMGAVPMIELPHASGQSKWQDEFFSNPKHHGTRLAIHGEKRKHGGGDHGIFYLGREDFLALIKHHLDTNIPVDARLFAALLRARERHNFVLASRGDGIREIQQRSASLLRRCTGVLGHELITHQAGLGMAHVKTQETADIAGHVVRVENGPQGKEDAVPGIALGIEGDTVILSPIYNPFSGPNGATAMECAGGMGGPKREFLQEAGMEGIPIQPILPAFVADPETEGYSTLAAVMAVTGEGSQQLDPEEKIGTPVKLRPHQVSDLITSGKIKDGRTLAVLCMYELLTGKF